MSKSFTGRRRIRFGHCDPAGIAYFPRCFELADAAVEDWCEQQLGVGRARLHLELGLGLPTVELHTRFTAVSRLGDWLDITIAVEEVGRTSVTLSIDATCRGEPRFSMTSKQVLMDLAKVRSAPWPEELRDRLSAAARETAQ